MCPGAEVTLFASGGTCLGAADGIERTGFGHHAGGPADTQYTVTAYERHRMHGIASITIIPFRQSPTVDAGYDRDRFRETAQLFAMGTAAWVVAGHPLTCDSCTAPVVRHRERTTYTVHPDRPSTVAGDRW